MRDHFVEGELLDGRFKTISPLNHGSFGMVFRARDSLTGQLVALKCLTKTSAGNTCPSMFTVDDRSEELAIHRRIGSHPNIVNLIHSFETKNHVYLVLEFCPNGDLYEAIRLGRGPLETEHVRDFMLELVSAVEYMHFKGIYHRDIKPENIFLTGSGSMKLGDFGLATKDVWSFESAVGSDRYMAPEQYDPAGNGYSPAEADVWAIGICLLNILFSRNPFAVPTFSDPLFADFAADRQTLFDVFPNMSQDTFEVLVHCLAIDPVKRSLSAVKEALERVLSFTTDDESLDEFCTDDHKVVGASANREPLRTPSFTTPHVEHGGPFPWAKALAMSPPQQIRQLSVIDDTESYSEDLFPSSERSDRDWFSVKPETASVVSFVDSGLGVSLKSTNVTQPEPINANRSKPLPISGSLPITAARPIPSLSRLFETRDIVSKSWCDLWDEDEEEHAEHEVENDFMAKGRLEGKAWSEESGSGRATPRGGLVELKNPSTIHNSRNRSPEAKRSMDERVSEHTGFIFEDHHSTVRRYSPPSKRSLLDRWTALGNMRRGQPPSSKVAAPVATPPGNKNRKGSRTGTWRRNVGWGKSHGSDNGVWEHAEWNVSKDWRQHAHGDEHVDEIEWVCGHDLRDLHL